MPDALASLAHLGLAPNASAKDIRRAYARELKLVDQEVDPAGFQVLRESYEAALQWHAALPSATDEAAPAPAQQEARCEPITEEPLPPPPQPEPFHRESPYVLAQEVLEEFRAECDRLVASKHIRDLERWELTLLVALDDSRLTELSARTAFEQSIAQQLANGWKPGHEMLFLVATDVFEWEARKRALTVFQQSGAYIGRAIEERQLYESQPESQQAEQRQVLKMLRANDAPSTQELLSVAALMDNMMTRFPHWLSVTVDMKLLEAWRLRVNDVQAMPYREVPGAKPTSTHQEAKATLISPRRRWQLRLSRYQVAAIVVFLLIGVNEFFTQGPPAPTGPNPFMGLPIPVSVGQLDAIADHIDFVPPAGNKQVQFTSEFAVNVDEHGQVQQTYLLNSSGNEGFDKAARKALVETREFPAGTETSFNAVITKRYELR